MVVGHGGLGKDPLDSREYNYFSCGATGSRVVACLVVACLSRFMLGSKEVLPPVRWSGIVVIAVGGTR